MVKKEIYNVRNIIFSYLVEEGISTIPSVLTNKEHIFVFGLVGDSLAIAAVIKENNQKKISHRKIENHKP